MATRQQLAERFCRRMLSKAERRAGGRFGGSGPTSGVRIDYPDGRCVWRAHNAR